MKQQMLSKVLLSTVVVMGSIAGSSLVMDDNAHAEQKSDNIGKLNQKNENTLHLSFEKGIKGTVDKNGKLTLSDGKTSKVMPTNAKDKKGNDVVLVYKKVKDGFDVQVIKSSQERKTNWVKCGLGTVGGAGTGGLGGASAASVIPGLGTVAGAIIGGVSGGATGAAASCFG
ncbi:TPA: hypothetical protein O9R64_002620 [Staphylococcus aureus]|nr:hypothetical protein [Staphylococcus aureus]